MEISEQIEGHHTSVSPGGRFIACVSNSKLRVSYAHAPERSTEFTIRLKDREVSSIRWSRNDNHIALCSAKQIEIINLDDPGRRIRLDNGSGGLGKLSSADFVGSAQLLTIWEFGRAKIWDLTSAKGTNLGDLKTTCEGPFWRVRPASDGGSQIRPLALLSRHGADDLLTLILPASEKPIQTVKCSTTDVQGLYWSPDGRWLALLDTASSTKSVHFYTPDGHLYRSYPPSPSPEDTGLGIKSLSWSADSSKIALARFDGKVILLNTKTFAPLAVIEHTTAIDQRDTEPDHQALIWLEVVSASHERSHTLSSPSVSLPLSKPKPTSDPAELGVAEITFNSNGTYLATRDERTLNTIWIWSMATWSIHAVVMQHSNVRRLHWHPHQPEMLMIDCGEGIAYFFDVSNTSTPPISVKIPVPGTPSLSWLPVAPGARAAILAATRSAFRVLYPDGADAASLSSISRPTPTRPESPAYDEGVSEGDDSLLALLSGRKPVPEKTEPSYTEMIDLDAEAADDEEGTMRLDDTFHGKGGAGGQIDPLDDSQIF